MIAGMLYAIGVAVGGQTGVIMLDLKRIGQFISDARKAKGLTQKQLADEIGVSDKAVSRWETGRGLPDTGTMPALCKSLDMSVNDLLSGEYLSVEAYGGKAEDNMVKLMEDNEEIRKKTKGNAVGTVMGAALLCLFFVGIVLFGRGQIGWFLDVPSFLAVTGVWLIIIGISGQFSDFFFTIKAVFHSKGHAAGNISSQIIRAEYAVDFGIKAMLFSGAILSSINIVLVFGVVFVEDISKLGPYLALAVLSALYAILFSIVFLIVKGKIHKML